MLGIEQHGPVTGTELHKTHPLNQEIVTRTTLIRSSCRKRWVEGAHKYGKTPYPISRERGVTMRPAESTISHDAAIEQLQEQGFSEQQIEFLLRFRNQYTDGTY